MKTILTCHDYGLSCPNSMQFDYRKSEICPLDPLSGACLKSPCMGESGQRVKMLRFGRSWASEKLFRVPQHLDRALCVSDFQRSVMQKHFGASIQLKTLCSPVYPASTELQAPAKASDFLWIGRMTAEKDAVTPARVCHSLGARLTIMGDGPQLDEVRAANPDATHFGWSTPNQVREAQCRARALILSSKCYETASLVVLECLAAGIPCIVPSISAATSWVEHDVNGLIYNVDDERSLAEAIRRMQDDGVVFRLGAAAFERYWQNPFTEERHRDELLGHYAEVLGS
jgi:glycosyltransferase involved in cell wall biosynthesis